MAGSQTTESAIYEASDVLDEAFRGVRIKPGKGVEHAHAVARALSLAGCATEVLVAGLLHDVVEHTAWTVADVDARFGARVGALVAAVTEDETIADHRRRKRALREQVAAAGPDAIDIALADKIASLDAVLATGARLSKRKRAHYESTMALAPHAAHPTLAVEVAELLARIAVRDGAAADGVCA